MDDKALIKKDDKLPSVELTTDIVRKYFCPKATDTEIMMFIKLCQYQKLNPWLRECYLVKYSDKMPASIVTGKETFTKRAYRHPKFRGHKTWTTGEHPKVMKGHAEVHVEGYAVPITVEVDFQEYVGKTKDFKTGEMKTNKMWASKPKTMIKKVALVQALREAFPEEFGGMYSPEEINTIEHDKLDEKPIDIKEATQKYVDAEFKETKETVKKPPEKPVEPSKPEQVSEPTPETKGAGNGDVGRQKRAHILAKAKWGLEGDAKLKAYLKEKYGTESTKDISLKDLQDVINYLNK